MLIYQPHTKGIDTVLKVGGESLRHGARSARKILTLLCPERIKISNFLCNVCLKAHPCTQPLRRSIHTCIGWGRGIIIVIYEKKAYSTCCSQAVTHPSTGQAQHCLTSVIGREPVHSVWYGRRHSTLQEATLYSACRQKKTHTQLLDNQVHHAHMRMHTTSTT